MENQILDSCLGTVKYKNKKFSLFGTNFEFQKDHSLSQIHLDMLVTVLFISHSDKEDYAQQTRTNLYLSPGLTTVFLHSLLSTILTSYNGNNFLKKKRMPEISPEELTVPLT